VKQLRGVDTAAIDFVVSYLSGAVCMGDDVALAVNVTMFAGCANAGSRTLRVLLALLCSHLE
jgi:hypothetical protein